MPEMTKKTIFRGEFRALSKAVMFWDRIKRPKPWTT